MQQEHETPDDETIREDAFITMVIDYLKTALDSFAADPADTPFQAGYQAALIEFMRHIDFQMRVILAKGETNG